MCVSAGLHVRTQGTLVNGSVWMNVLSENQSTEDLQSSPSRKVDYWFNEDLQTVFSHTKTRTHTQASFPRRRTINKWVSRCLQRIMTHAHTVTQQTTAGQSHRELARMDRRAQWRWRFRVKAPPPEKRTGGRKYGQKLRQKSIHFDLISQSSSHAVCRHGLSTDTHTCQHTRLLAAAANTTRQSAYW